MTVNVARAEAAGLTTEYEDRTYAFCGPGCRRAFAEEPATYAAQADAARRFAEKPGLPVIDDGMRRWYDSCSCCLSEAYPEIKAALDAEHEVAAVTPIDLAAVATSPRRNERDSPTLERSNRMTDRRTVAVNEDPVCGMTVDVDQARRKGLTTELEGREYVFCGKGCLLEFRDTPDQYLDPRHMPMM